ncbi:hypothetical protein [Chryseobacterium cheonjiense]|uniref:Uncharacterized protein n=1 Tax=Chryseobacterium cheonjiense TaxID=2728845 RepID=A0A7Y0A554_9FLAO|nr:hypothetical protein [Chryseobacterium cheonjiense]NML56765.1 hypothetical protein [Chryseobacterium cheonjiense]
MENKLTNEIGVISHFEIAKWASNGWYELFRSGMYEQISTLRNLIKAGLPYNFLLDEFFMLGRDIAVREGRIEPGIKNEILECIIETGLKIYNNSG